MRTIAAKTTPRRASSRPHASKRRPELRAKLKPLEQDHEQVPDADPAVSEPEPWDEREPERQRESTFDRAQQGQELGDVERGVEADHCREESDIEH